MEATIQKTICGAISDLDLEDAMSLTSRGDARAFARVFELLWDPLLRWAVYLAGDRSLAEDVAQESLVKIWTARATYRPGARVLPWARTIVRRTLIDALRRTRDEHEASLTSRVFSPEHARSAEDETEARRLQREVFEGLSRLPRRQAEVLCIAADGVSMAAAAEQAGTSALAMRLRLCRARVALREEIGGRNSRAPRA